MAAKSIFEQTGWKRPYHKMICQEHAALIKVYEFDYDLEDPAFVKYFEKRTGIMISKMECGWSLTRLLYAPGVISKKELEQISAFRLTPTSPRIDASAEIKTMHHRITRARLQDAWELYNFSGTLG